MYFIAFFVGFFTGFSLFFLLFFIVRELIFRHGKFIVRRLEKEINVMYDKTQEGTEIIYPNNSKEIFEKEESKIEDLLKS